MDDDDDDDEDTGDIAATLDGGSRSSGSRRQGEYQLPTAGVCFLWQRDGGVYTALSIRDLSSNTDIVKAKFESTIKAASTTKGRRSFTSLPPEDLVLLRTELAELGSLSMQVCGGSILSSHAIASPCTMRDIENIIHLSPWTSSSHRIELVSVSASKRSKTQFKPTAGTGAITAAAAATSSEVSTMLVSGPSHGLESSQSQSSKIDDALNCLRTTLAQMNNSDSAGSPLDLITSLSSWLKVVKGTRSRARGGSEYLPSYMLNAVLLSDRLTVLDDMGDAMRELLVLVLECFGFHFSEVSLRHVGPLLRIATPSPDFQGVSQWCYLRNFATISTYKCLGSEAGWLVGGIEISITGLIWYLFC